MATTPPTHSEGAARRVVLIDFDWRDVDLVPDLLRRPGIVVGMVAGEKPDDVGVRVAELCGVRQSVDLADLTREFFDLAILGEASPRRAQIERLLQALGTPVTFPREISASGALDLKDGQTVSLAASPVESDGRNMSDLLDRAIPDLGFGDAPETPPPAGPRRWPERNDRPGLERVLAACRESTAVSTVELHFGAPGRIERLAGIGPEDPLLRTLARLALDLESPQVVAPLTADGSQRVWGAWPFRVEDRRGVVAVAGIEGTEGRAAWERWTRELREQWTRGDQDRATADGTAAGCGWLPASEFRVQLERAVERNHDHHAPCVVHRLRFLGSAAAVERLCGTLPGQLRDSDCICRSTPTDVLLLWSGARNDYTHLRRRLIVLWEQAWREAGESPPPPPIMDERTELEGPEEVAAFRDAASHWISGA